MHYLTLGTLVNDDAVLNKEGEVITPATPIAGYHLNTSAKLEGLDAYLSNPSKPKVKLNTEKQYFYTFADEAEFKSFCMSPVYETGEFEFNTDLFIPNIEVPEKVTARQAHGILIIRGLHRAIVAHFEAQDEPERSLGLNDFERSQHFYRHNSSLEKSALAMGMTSEQVDELFIEAGKLFLEEETE